MITLAKLFDFVAFTNKFQAVVRTILIRSKTDRESDPEHSYQLALVGWYLNEANNLGLDTDLLIKYALIHDLVETYAGDAHFYKASERRGKNKREQKAAQKIVRKFPGFKSYKKLVYDYETRTDTEAKFVYALDKLLPVINIYLDNGRSWKRNKVSLQMLIAGKTEKIKIAPEIDIYFQSILTILKRNHKQLFNV